MEEENKKEVVKEEEKTIEAPSAEEQAIVDEKITGLDDKIIEVKNERDLEKGDAKYDANDLTVLEGLEAVRKRPGMYIGSTSSTGLHHLVWEIVDNGIDEALAGYCDTVKVTINKDNTVTVEDNGRGIPVDIVKKSGLSGVETVYTILHAGGKFGETGGYKVSGGLHGVGASVVNALSEWVDVYVHRDGGIFYLRFENGGHAVGHLARVGDCSDHGTIVTFKPDKKIFKETTEFNYETINNRLRQMAFLNKGISIVFSDLRDPDKKPVTYKYEGGIVEYVKFLNKDSAPLTTDIQYFEGAQNYVDNELKEIIIVETALQYTSGYNSKIYSYCNNVATGNGGMHEDGFALALVRVFNNYARGAKILKDQDKERFTYDDCCEGLTAIISVKHPNPQYEGQTKGKLGNPEVKKIVSNVVGDKLERFLMENKAQATLICNKIKSSYDERLAAKAARENTRRKNSLELSTLPGKLADCSSQNPEECELFIVEGNSAGGSAKMGRDSRTQAILPLRGKILNVQKAQMHRIFDNGEIGNMINAIGSGYGDDFDISKARYHKIVIMTDADVDGSHIRILLLTFFHRFMKPLIDNGYVYIAQPPLYKLSFHSKDYYAYSDDQLDNIRAKLGITNGGYALQRYKGLGEMDPQQLESTTMDPKFRKMLKVTVDDAIAADQVFNDLMGEDVPPRTEFIQRNAKFVKNLDI
ncbi:MAG: DNA topoisomerase (ATP-hydrolyzing) subunit B [Bacilli bacterium]